MINVAGLGIFGFLSRDNKPIGTKEFVADDKSFSFYYPLFEYWNTTNVVKNKDGTVSVYYISKDPLISSSPNFKIYVTQTQFGPSANMSPDRPPYQIEGNIVNFSWRNRMITVELYGIPEKTFSNI